MKGTLEPPTDCTQQTIPVKETPPAPGETVLPAMQEEEERRVTAGATADDVDEEAPTEIDPMCGVLYEHPSIIGKLEKVEGEGSFYDSESL